MKTAHFLATILALSVFTNAYAQGVSSPVVSKPIVPWVNNGWREEESVIARALAIRAKIIEEKTGIKFGDEWTPKVSLEWTLGGYGKTRTAAEYKGETQTIYFTISMVYEINVRHKTTIRLLDPEILAKDDEFGKLADHELGHALSEEVSRRIGKGPYFTVERFYGLKPEERLGLNIVAEGIGEFIEHIRYPTNEKLSEMFFPATIEEQRMYIYDIIVFQGGYWLVKDILSQYGERGLEWLIAHPFFVDYNNMRKSAVEYRKRALEELAR